MNAVFDSTIVEIICSGDSILFGGNFIAASGMYTDSLTTSSTCDSLIHLDLTVLPSYQVELVESICEGQEFQVGTSSYDSTGMYVDSLLSANGCDSIISLSLVVSDVLLNKIDSTICDGEVVQIGNSIYDASGNYSDTLSSIAGCDSIVQLALTVGNHFLDTLHVDLCAGDSLFFDSSYLTNSGVYVDSLLTSAMCDSVLVLELNVLESFNSATIHALCEGDSIMLHGSWFTQDTILMDTLIAFNSCDSCLLYTSDAADE